ncbi:MAG TPA: cytochrome c oxidase subunit 2A [Bacillus bacterium]|nr:cytochrome c oxidase subunit 2A [Bacillus sp. (in: firmicutes)]
MAKPELHHKTQVEDSSSLRGTLVMTSILGIILVFSWFGIFNLYLNR